MPALETYYQRRKAEGLRVIAVSMDEAGDDRGRIGIEPNIMTHVLCVELDLRSHHFGNAHVAQTQVVAVAGLVVVREFVIICMPLHTSPPS